MNQFYVLSLKHTKRRDKAITLWRPDDCGYCWTLERAGLYEESKVLEHLGYYNSGCTNVAIPTKLVRELCCEVEYDTKEFGTCLRNDAKTWRALLNDVIRPTPHEPRPEYRGAKHTDNSLWVRRQRCEQVNEAIRIIGSHGRRFFYDDHRDRFAKLEVDLRGKVWIIDEYTGKRIYTHPTTWGNKWRGFNHGGTLRDLVERFRDFICEGKQLHPGYLGPERFDDSNIWGYEEASMQAVRSQAGSLPVFLQASERLIAGGAQ